MTEPTALEEIVARRQTEISVARQVNWRMYKDELAATAALLHASVQITQDALYAVCVEHNSVRPAELLELLHALLATVAEYSKHEQAGANDERERQADEAQGKPEEDMAYSNLSALTVYAEDLRMLIKRMQQGTLSTRDEHEEALHDVEMLHLILDECKIYIELMFKAPENYNRWSASQRGEEQ